MQTHSDVFKAKEMEKFLKMNKQLILFPQRFLLNLKVVLHLERSVFELSQLEMNVTKNYEFISNSQINQKSCFYSYNMKKGILCNYVQI